MNLGPFAVSGYHVGDCRDLLRQLPDGCIHCCVTSPPYWGLRDYGTGSWEGGDPDCNHAGKLNPKRDTSGGTNGRFADTRGQQPAKAYSVPLLGDCACGARRVDSQLGLEPTPAEYVAHMVEVFREVKRVLRNDGTLWLNLGDTYSRLPEKGDNTGWGKHSAIPDLLPGHARQTGGLPPKNLVGIPWLVAFALQADGWYLRSDIIWEKSNPMPESVTDRPTRAHEYLFLLTKSEHYYYDNEAIKEEASKKSHPRGDGVNPKAGKNETSGLRRAVGFNQRWMVKQNASFSAAVTGLVEKRNKRDVWTIGSEPTPEAHFATFPTELVRTCILAGTSERGVCATCGAPLERVVEQAKIPDRPGRVQGRLGDSIEEAHGQDARAGDRYSLSSRTIGWGPTCACRAAVVPAVVLDPFGGSGTTGQVAEDLHRKWILFDLSAEYAKIAKRKTAQPSLLTWGK